MAHYWKANPTQPEATGYFGAITATLDWCERNYAVTHNVAEFWNTISNLFMIVLGLLGLIRSLKATFGAQELPIRLGMPLIVSYLTLFAVGVGSSAFHATLLFQAQLLDEVPMLWCCCVFAYCVCPPGWRKSPLFLLALLLYGAGLPLFYALFWRSAVFFECSYGIGVVYLIIRSVQLARAHPDLAATNRLVRQATAGYLIGWTFWNLDNLICVQLDAFREHSLPGLLRPFFEFHCLWHVLSGLATYQYILFASAVFVKVEAGLASRLTFLFGVVPVLQITGDPAKRKLP